jgi:hypothetical protein
VPKVNEWSQLQAKNEEKINLNIRFSKTVGRLIFRKTVTGDEIWRSVSMTQNKILNSPLEDKSIVSLKVQLKGKTLVMFFDVK